MRVRCDVCSSNGTDLCLSPFVAFGWFYRYEGKLPSIRKVLCWLCSVWCGCKEKEKLLNIFMETYLTSQLSVKVS